MKHHVSTLFLIAFATINIIVGASRIYAADRLQKIAEKHNITFPVKELGGCNNLGECRQFCDDPINQPTCIAFAKTKKFYKGDVYKQRRAAALFSAQNELGCNSEKACREVCQRNENQEKCRNFAQKYNLQHEKPIDIQKTGILVEAKTTLGCNSPTTCADFCSQESNKQKCSNFANQTGLSGGEIHQGPGGCASADSCHAFCSDPNHFNECKNFVSPPNSGATSTFRGPGGCDSESSCKQYCDLHHEECSTGIPSGGANPTGIQNNPTPSTTTSSNALIDCIGPDGKHFQATQQDCDNFNKAWGKTPTSSSGTSGSTSSFSNQTYSSLSSSGSLIDCTGPDGHHFQATQAQCDYFNNAWKTATAQTGTSGSSGTSSPTSTSGSSGGCDTACQQSYCSQCGGSWTGGTCVNAHCGVHGISTNRNVLEWIIDLIFGR